MSFLDKQICVRLNTNKTVSILFKHILTDIVDYCPIQINMLYFSTVRGYEHTLMFHCGLGSIIILSSQLLWWMLCFFLSSSFLRSFSTGNGVDDNTLALNEKSWNRHTLKTHFIKHPNKLLTIKYQPFRNLFRLEQSSTEKHLLFVLKWSKVIMSPVLFFVSL